MTAGTQIPPVPEFLWPTLCAVVSLGDSGTIDEIVEATIGGGGFSEEQLAVPHGDGRESEVVYRCAWARTYLKGMGLLDNSQRGVWSTTELGRAVAEADIPRLLGEYRNRLREARKANAEADEADELGPLGDEGGSDGPRDWKAQLIAMLQGGIEPDQFERLARRLLLEAGFVSATVTGKSGDGGIDGIGLYRLSLVKAIQGDGSRQRCSRLPRCHERQRRARTADHDRNLLTGRSQGSNPRRCATGRPD
jgi:restriction system protein